MSTETQKSRKDKTSNMPLYIQQKERCSRSYIEKCGDLGLLSGEEAVRSP